jgi:predicted transcriptional regulator
LKESVGARIKELREEGLIEKVNRGEHKISTVKLEKFLDNLINKLSLVESVEASG